MAKPKEKKTASGRVQKQKKKKAPAKWWEYMDRRTPSGKKELPY